MIQPFTKCLYLRIASLVNMHWFSIITDGNVVEFSVMLSLFMLWDKVSDAQTLLNQLEYINPPAKWTCCSCSHVNGSVQWIDKCAIFGEEYKSWSSLLCSFLQSHLSPRPSYAQISSSSPSSQTPSAYVLLSMRETSLHTHIIKSYLYSLFIFTFIDPQKVTLETMGCRIGQKNINKYITYIRKTKETEDVS